MSQPARKSTVAGAFGAKTARACDSCLKRRARWYCTADDAFLCQQCDNSVHSANPLARRHERVRLKTSSSSSFKPEASEDDAEPSWHHGLKRKARTPRGGTKGSIAEKEEVQGMFGRGDTIVPDLELASLEEFAGVEEEQLLYRVPIMNPLLAGLCSSPPTSDEDTKELQPQPDQSFQDLTGFLIPPDMDIPEFDMDVETLLGRELDEDAFCMEGLGLAEVRDQCPLPAVKMEEEMDDRREVSLPPTANRQMKVDVDLSGETIDVHFDPSGDGERKWRRIMLDLNYEGVICAWGRQACPWIDGARPQIDHLDDLSPEFNVNWGEVPRLALAGCVHGAGDGGREARVSRYREKRRTRLFSKKIRYEVRKLNAEKRPRMKGRFVKRSSLLSNATAGTVPSHLQYVF